MYFDAAGCQLDHGDLRPLDLGFMPQIGHLIPRVPVSELVQVNKCR